MNIHSAPVGVPDGATRARRDIPPLDVMAEVERLLAGRTRDICLKGEVRRLFRERTWPQTAKIIRSWMIWVVLLDVVTLVVSLLTLPPSITDAMLVPASLLPLGAIAVVFVWRKPGAAWMQESALVGGMFFILLCIALAGVSAGDEFYERHLSIMLFVALTGIIIFAVPLPWTATIAAMALGIYVVFQLQNPGIDVWSAVDGTLFFVGGIIATVVARRTMTILAQKAFLLELRDKKRVAELAEANDRLEQLARTDPLTGVANRRWLSDILDSLWDADKTCPTGAAMLMCDIDEFKLLNDHLGHADGDRCLVELAGIIEGCLARDWDRVARYGGEEFLVLLPATGEHGAVAVADRIRRRIEAAAVPNPRSRVSRYVTVSIGVAAIAPGTRDVSPDELQRRADAALYQAKQEGRNRVVLHGPGLAETPTACGNAGRPPRGTLLQ